MPATMDLPRHPADITGRRWKAAAKAEEDRKRREQSGTGDPYKNVLLPVVEQHISVLQEYLRVNNDVEMDAQSLESLVDSMLDLIEARDRIAKREDENAPLDFEDARSRPGGAL